MAWLTILTPKELHTVYALPQFTDEERDTYFSLDSREKQALEEFRTFTAKTYFILQLGYFKSKKQFFVFDVQTVADDLTYILQKKSKTENLAKNRMPKLLACVYVEILAIP